MAKIFTRNALNSIRSVGSIAPSSKYLVADMLKIIDFNKDLNILEFGPGNGVITKAISKKITKKSKLITYELNVDFYNHVESAFSEEENVFVLNKSAFDFDEYLRKVGISHIDYIVSSLPLALFKKEDKVKLFKKCGAFLKQEGAFLQYQYSLNSYKTLKENFNKVNLSFTLINLPPAIIYQCSGPK